MAWNELDASGNYFICFRVGSKRFKRSLKTQCKKDADNLTARVEENLQLLERGRLVIPQDADVVTFLLSDGRVKLRGWHVLRHSFISCLAAKGVDQRIIDDFSGHQTEEQRRRYRHLIPNVTKQAITSVFG